MRWEGQKKLCRKVSFLSDNVAHKIIMNLKEMNFALYSKLFKKDPHTIISCCSIFSRCDNFKKYVWNVICNAMMLHISVSIVSDLFFNIQCEYS